MSISTGSYTARSKSAGDCAAMCRETATPRKQPYLVLHKLKSSGWNPSSPSPPSPTSAPNGSCSGSAWTGSRNSTTPACRRIILCFATYFIASAQPALPIPNPNSDCVARSHISCAQSKPAQEELLPCTESYNYNLQPAEQKSRSDSRPRQKNRKSAIKKDRGISTVFCVFKSIRITGQESRQEPAAGPKQEAQPAVQQEHPPQSLSPSKHSHPFRVRHCCGQPSCDP